MDPTTRRYLRTLAQDMLWMVRMAQIKGRDDYENRDKGELPDRLRKVMLQGDGDCEFVFRNEDGTEAVVATSIATLEAATSFDIGQRVRPGG